MASAPHAPSGAAPTSRPGTRGYTPLSQTESLGIETVAFGESQVNASEVAEEMAEDVTSAMIDNVLDQPLTQVPEHADPSASGLREELAALRARDEQITAELASAKGELEFAALKEEELENRNRLAQRTIESLKNQVDSLLVQTVQSSGALVDTQDQLDSHASERCKLEDDLLKANTSISASQGELLAAREELSRSRMQPSERERALEEECSSMRQKLSAMSSELSDRKALLASTELPSAELAGDSSDEKPFLHAAYQKISELNTQLAHLYTELTMARTEVRRLRSEGGPDAAKESAESQAQVEKQNKQIADLVSDIRHLQLDLEYHQQKLDQMIEEKQQMMKELKKAQSELKGAKVQIEERDQMLKHREVDLVHVKQELKSKRGSADEDGNASNATAVAALRAEAAAKDSALIVSHYELHKEKLLRDRLEQKNLKLMERMQKLMMVVETMRRDNMALERAGASKDKALDDKDKHLRAVSQKARDLKKSARNTKSVNNSKATALELDTGSLPPLTSRQVDSALGGSRSGMSTPRTPRAPPSPYGIR